MQSFHSPCGRASCFFSCGQEEVTKKKATPVARSPRIRQLLLRCVYQRHPCRRRPSESARGLSGSLNARPCTCSERARIVRALLRTFPAPPRRATGAPFGGILPQKPAAPMGPIQGPLDDAHVVAAIKYRTISSARRQFPLKITNSVTSGTARFIAVARLAAAGQHFGAGDATLVTLATSNRVMPGVRLASMGPDGVAQ